MIVSHTENGVRKQIGTIVMPFNWFNPKIHVLDKNGNQIYRVEASCCQLAFWFNLPCDSCQYVLFNIYDGLGQPVSKLEKRTAGCVRAMTWTGANFGTTFPKDATEEQRALLVAATVFLDYMFFEEPKNKNNNNNPMGITL